MENRIRYAAAGDENTAKIVVTGDLCPLGVVEQQLVEGGTERVFGEILPELLDKDLAVTNLETVLTRSQNAIEKCGPNLKTAPECLPALNRAGFDVYALANNHTRDFGDEAFLETMLHIENSGKRYVGGGENPADAARALRLEVRGLRISILSATMHNICVAAGDRPGANPLEPAALAVRIAAEKKENDFVLAVIHDGKEHCPFPSARIRGNYRAFIDAGADAVIGHHPHIMQGFERYKAGFIAYSLGNFLFPPRSGDVPGFWTKSYFLRLHVGRRGVFGVDVVPHELSPEGCMRRLSGEKLDDFSARLAGLNRILADDLVNDRYYAALALRNTYYMQRVMELIRLTEAGNKGEDYHAAAFYCHHMLTTEEHLDVIQSITGTCASRHRPEPPEDLDFFVKY